MKTESCNRVAERVVLGEELGDLAEHAAACAKCRTLVALPIELGATSRDVDPGMGFASRMTIGARHRMVVRRRQRYAAGAGVVLAAAASLMFFVMREPEPTSVAYVPVELLPHLPAIEPVAHKPDPWEPREPGKVDDDVRALVHLANVDRSRHISAHWGRIEKSLAPYSAVLKGTEP